ncbi:hypothetical protein F4813DRAFT_394955 [Daldinia decipiens]|uniref:uncharacterized protein n=1 Tax=Daldinia decipiens TaxID=326647 RepID=UPI0020C21AAE|nr:uncharacterized protein F4813DRAFT_394955 [Daldinia decipiens]KAI1662840.1 hypothetical protein F4813DRAFT_394955 [Daldinia decipiens]
MSLWIDAGATPPALDKIKLAEYLKGDPSIINKPDPASGLTPLAAAIRKGNSSTVKLLLDNGANPDTKTQDGRTPMFMAASAPKQRARMIQLLLAKNPNSFDEAGPASFGNETPLMVATRKGDAAAIKLLVEAGASKEKKNASGQTAKDIADKLQPSDLAVKEALDIIATKGKGGLITYINEWVLKVLAYYDIWSPLADIFDASSGTYYKVPGSNPAPGEDIAEPQTVEDFKNNLNNAVKRGGLEKFFSPNDPYLTDVAERAFELKNDPKNPLNSPSQVDGLAKLALYQPILYCDDSGSMWSEENGKGKGDRWRAQVELVKRISSIASRTDPLNRGCHLRFINQETPDANGLNKDQIEHKLKGFYPEGWTPIGTKLRENVLDPLIYKDVDAGIPLKRPFLVLVTTDGYPTREKAGKGGSTGKLDENENEDADRFRKEIHECAMRFENSKENYRKDVVRFSISQIGKNISYAEDEEKVKAFLDGLEYDADIQDVLYRTAELMDSRYEELRENEEDLERWLLSTLLSPLQSLYNQ